MSPRFVSVAEQELREALDYYEATQPGLGSRLLDEVEASLGRIASHPDAWTRISPRTRRCRVNHFPFGLCYQIRSSEIVVVAVMDLRRDPRRWEERI
jgi:plasmid stabilization system protein ParE